MSRTPYLMSSDRSQYVQDRNTLRRYFVLQEHDSRIPCWRVSIWSLIVRLTNREEQNAGYLGGATATQARLEDPWFLFPVGAWRAGLAGAVLAR